MIRRTGRNAAYLRRARALATALAAVAVTLSTALASSGAQARGATLLYAERFDPAAAAHLEVQWWRVHRDAQRSTRASDGPALADALARLHSHVYGVPERSVRRAAEQRALAMRYSDQWVSEGCHPDSTLINHERDALVRPYAALLEAVQSPQCPA